MDDICNAAFGNKYTDIALNYTKLFEEKSQDLANILSPSKTDDYVSLKNKNIHANYFCYSTGQFNPHLFFLFLTFINY
jgi:hypothetical protein